VLASYVSTSSIGTQPEERDLYFRKLATRLETLPWVSAVTVTDYAPLSPHSSAEVRADDESVMVPVTLAKVVPGYFEVLRIGLVAGRTFVPLDTVNGTSVAVINETLAARFFGDRNPVGRQITWKAPRVDGEKTSEIVGVVRNSRLETLMGDAETQLYVSYPQVYYTPGNAILVSTTIDPLAAVPRLQAEYRAVDSRLAVVNVLPYSEVLEGFLYSQRMNAELFAIVAVLGLVLAAVGIFGVMNLAVGLRTREIGIRLAVGARGGDIVRLVARRAAMAVGLGTALGLAGSLVAARWTQSLLYGVTPGDVPSFVVAALTIAAAAGLAAYLPTRRALAVDPMKSVRVE
jgi:putative ABC transport system permease protein